MVLIKGEWYDIIDLDDAVKLIREEFNYDLADRIEELVKENNLDKDIVLGSANDEIDDLKDYIDDLKLDNSDLNNIISELRDEIKDLEESIKYWSSQVVGEE